MTQEGRAAPAWRPALRPEVEVGGPRYRGPKTVHLLVDDRDGRCYEVGEREHFVIDRMRGRRTLDEISDDYAAAFGRPIGGPGWQRMLGLLYSRDLLLPAAPPPTSPTQPAPVRRSPGPRPSDWRTGRLVFGGTSTLIDRLYRVLGWCFSPWVQVPGALAVLAGLGLVGANLPELWEDTLDLRHRPLLLVAVLAFLWASLSLHEVAHGLTARHFGSDASEIGLLFRPPMVFLYARVQTAPLLNRRWPSIAVALAGGLTNIVLVLPFALWWLLADPGSRTGQTLSALILLGTGTGLVNFLPLPPLDGYAALGQAVGALNLAPDSTRCVRETVRRVAYPPRLRALYLGYAVLRAVLLLAVLAELVWFCRSVLSGWQGVTALAGIALFVVSTLARPLLVAKPVPEVPEIPETPAPHRPAPRTTTPGVAQMTPQTPRGPVIEAVSVRKSYGAVTAVDGITLTVQPGEFFGVLGPNGAGKTTFLELLEGLRRPDSGEIRVLGEATWPRNLALLPRIGVQTQASSFFPTLTAREHITTVAALYGVGVVQADATLERFGLSQKARVQVGKLSGGQRQRLAIACAVVHDPEVIFLDEPTASLDPQARRDLWELLEDLKHQGRTTIYTTHHIDEAEKLCDRVAILEHGRVITVGRPRDLVRKQSAQVQVSVPRERLTLEAAMALAGVQDARHEGTSTILTTADPGAVLTAMAASVGLDDVQTRTATLEDVYLRLTGKDLEA